MIVVTQSHQSVEEHRCTAYHFVIRSRNRSSSLLVKGDHKNKNN